MIYYTVGKQKMKEVSDTTIIPRVNEHITFDDEKEYVVTLVVHDYKSKTVHVCLRPASSNDVTFL